MHTLLACSTFALTVSLAVGRPRVGANLRLGPATSAVMGALLLLSVGTVGLGDVGGMAETLWRPLITILSIMLTTAAASRVGMIDALVHIVFSRRDVSIRRLFANVFALSLTTASVLNNDAAVLLLTPLVITLIRTRYSTQPQLAVPFAFAVFMAAGVAPFVVSNPMNIIVASYAGLNFNAYTARMLPISLIGSFISFWLLRRVFSKDLTSEVCDVDIEVGVARLTVVQKWMLVLLAGVIGSYPVIASIDGSKIWVVSAVGALLALLLTRRDARASPLDVLRRDVAWDILIFLPAMFVLAIGLRNVGLVEYLTTWYADASIALVGATAAFGSAVLNNHPMALVNILALGEQPGADGSVFLAALIGGDLGPRLLPIGSLAGLIWLELCRRRGVEIPLRQFVTIGFTLTIPTLVASLLLLAVM
jgi:arsenical pump membrane protein